MIATKDNPTSIVEGLLVFGHSLMDRFRLDQFEGSVSLLPPHFVSLFFQA